MSITYRPAQLDGVGLFIALAGGSRTGKTYTALTLARGIAGPAGRIACIDTEGKRMSHYKNAFLNADSTPFDVFNMQSPFGAERFYEAAKAAQDAKYDVLVIDSFSLEWSGVGGVLQLYDDAFEAAKFNQKMSDNCWKIAKKQHKRMLDDMIQLTIPIIFCLRAGEVPLHLGGGWKVVQDKNFLYEWTVALTLHSDTPGMPRYDLFDAKKKPLWKVQDQHRHLFPEGKLITAAAGAALQKWRSTDAALASTSVHRTVEPPTPEEIRTALVNRFEATETVEDHEAIEADEIAAQQANWLLQNHPDLGSEVTIALRESKRRTSAPAFRPAARSANDSTFPGDLP